MFANASRRQARIEATRAVGNSYGNIDISGNARVQVGDSHHYHQQNDEIAEVKYWLECLSFPEMYTRFDDIVDAEEETCRWAHDSDLRPVDYSQTDSKEQHPLAAFSNWYHRGCGPFWVSGKPGSGKSTLTKHLLQETVIWVNRSMNENLNSCSTRPIVLGYFFWLYGTPLQRSISGCLRSLLCQLLKEPSTCQKSLECLRREIPSRNAWTVKRLRTVLITLLHSFPTTTFIFLDGLDECDDQSTSSRLAQTLGRINGVKVLVSSRPEPCFRSEFYGAPSLEMQDVNADDIETLIRTKLSQGLELQFRATEPDFEFGLAKLIESIIDKAEGVFLWVYLVLQNLLEGVNNRDDVVMLTHRVDALPSDMHRLYTDMLQRQSKNYAFHKTETARYLRAGLDCHHECGLIGFVLLTNDKIRESYLQIPAQGSLALASNNVPDIRALKTLIHSRTAGLLQVSGSPLLSAVSPAQDDPNLIELSNYEVRFVHRTAADYVKTGDGRKLLLPSRMSDAQWSRALYQMSLITFVVRPALRDRSLNFNTVRLAFYTSPDSLSYDMIRNESQDIWAWLRDKGCIFTQPYNKTLYSVSTENAFNECTSFPSPRYAGLDFVQLLIVAEKYHCAEQMLDVFNLWHDAQYLSSLLTAFSFYLHDGTYPKSDEALLKRMLSNGARPDRELRDLDGDVCYPVFELSHAYFRNTAYKDFSRLEVEQYVKNPGLMQQTRCDSCHVSWYKRRLPSGEGLVYLWGDYSSGDIASLKSGKSAPLQQSRVRILVGSDSSNPTGFTMRTISGRTSVEILFRPASYVWTGDQLATYSDSAEHYLTESFLGADSDAFNFISFANAMKYLGKSDEVIRSCYLRNSLRIAKTAPNEKDAWEKWYWGSERPPDL